MSTTTIQMIGGQSPWEIVRAYPYVKVRPYGNRQLEISCRTPDDSGWPMVHALEALTTEERHRYDADVASGLEPAGREAMIPGRAMMRLVREVKAATGAEPPAWKTFAIEAAERCRPSTAQAVSLPSS